MVVRRKVASAYEDGAKQRVQHRVQRYGLITCTCLLVIYLLTGHKEKEVKTREINVRSKSNSFSGPYDNPLQQKQPQQQQPQEYQQLNQQQQQPPPSPEEVVNESVLEAQEDIEQVASREATKGQEVLLEKSLEAAAETIKQHEIENRGIDPKEVEMIVAERLETEVLSKLAEATVKLVEEKETILNKVVAEDKVQGLDSKAVIQDVAAMEEISIKDIKQEISEEVDQIQKKLHHDASIIESQVLQEKLDHIIDSDQEPEEEDKDIEEEETSQTEALQNKESTVSEVIEDTTTEYKKEADNTILEKEVIEDTTTNLEEQIETEVTVENEASSGNENDSKIRSTHSKKSKKHKSKADDKEKDDTIVD